MQRKALSVTDDASPEFRAEFERLYRAHAAEVRRHLGYLTGDRSLAEDLTQEAFGKLYARGLMTGGVDLDSPSAWLLTVASNLAYNHFRAESRRATREELPGVATVAGIASQPELDDVLDVRDALARLDARDRIVLMLRHSGFAYAEIAAVIDVAPSSVGTLIARAQSRFRTAYTGADGAVTKE